MSNKMLKIAIIQEPPVYLNLLESIDKAEKLLFEAATKGAKLVVFPETWLPGYPVWVDSAPEAASWDNPGPKNLYSYLFNNSLKIGGREFKRLADLCDELEMYVVMGVNEKHGSTLYNTMIFFDGLKKVYKVHRKLVPTYTERLIWGRGDGSTFAYLETEYGNIGGLICWEHWMPFARAVMHSFNEKIHIAQWPSVRELHQLGSRHYAFEGRCFVIASGTVIKKNDVIDGFKSLNVRDNAALDLLYSMKADKEDFLYDGGSSVIAPDSSYQAGPIYDQAGIVYSELNLEMMESEYMYLDTDGHYSRPDIFTLNVDTSEQINVKFNHNK